MSITVILPKHPSITSVYVADTMESDEDLNEFSQTCEQSLTWNGKDSRSRTWLQRLKRMKWMRLLFSRTLKPSHTTSFVDAWTSYLRDSHANPFPVAVNDNQPTTQDTCTRGLQMELPLADHDLCCFNHFSQDDGGQGRSKGLFVGRIYNANESSSWPTSTALARKRPDAREDFDFVSIEDQEGKGRNDACGEGAIKGMGTTELVPDDTSAGTCSNDQGVRQGTSGTSRRQGTDRPRFPARPNERQYEWEEPRTFVAELGGATDGRT